MKHFSKWNFLFSGLYGTLFRRNKEAAFSNYRLWESAGFVIAYAYSTHLCARMKLYVMLTVLLVGTCGYIVVELLHRRKQKRLKAIAEDPKAAQAEANQVEETDDEKDDIDDDIIITHLWNNIMHRRGISSVAWSTLLFYSSLLLFPIVTNMIAPTANVYVYTHIQGYTSSIISEWSKSAMGKYTMIVTRL